MERFALKELSNNAPGPVHSFFLAIGKTDEISHGLLGDLAAHDGDRFGQGDLFGADAGAVLGITAIANSPLFHEGAKALFGIKLPNWMGIEKPGLRNRRWTDEFGEAVNLGTPFAAAATGHAGGKVIHLLLNLRIDLGAKAAIVGVVDIDPGADAFQLLEHAVAVHYEIFDKWKFGEGSEGDGRVSGLFDDLIDER